MAVERLHPAELPAGIVAAKGGPEDMVSTTNYAVGPQDFTPFITKIPC
jgi:hypothetical protein